MTGQRAGLRGLRGTALLVVGGLILSSSAAAQSRTVDFPVPELGITVAPVPLGLTRPPLELSPPPPATAPAIELRPAAPPRFQSQLAKPWPTVRDPGGTACTFAFGRAAQLAECGVSRLLQGDTRGAREALDDSLLREPRGPQAGAAQLWLGELALREARLEPAERHYRAALGLALTPELRPHALLGVGWTLLRRGDFPNAQQSLAQAVGSGAPAPLGLLARFLEGAAWLSGGRPAEALAIWDAVLDGLPGPELAEEVTFWRGIAQASLGRPDEALAALDRFLASASPRHPLGLDAIVHAGWAALARGTPEEAIRRFLWASSLNPRAEVAVQIRAGLVRAYLATGDSPRAQETGRLLVRDAGQSPLVPPVLQLLAEDAARRQAWAEAADTFRAVLAHRLSPELEAYAMYRVGELLERQGRTAEAKWQYRTLRDRGRNEAIAQRAAYRLGLLALRDQDAAAARAEGEGLLRAGVVHEMREPVILLSAEAAARAEDPNRAVTLLRLFLTEYPASSRAGDARLALGWMLLRDGNPESALRAWQETTLAPVLETAVLAHLAIADLALVQGREPIALQALEEAAKLAPGHPLADTIALDRGLLAVRAGAFAVATQQLEPLLPRTTPPPRQLLLRRALGLARYQLGQHDAAEQHFRQATQLAPAEATNWLGLGLAAFHQSRLTEADQALDAALARARQSPAREVWVRASYARVLVAARQRNEPAFRERATEFVDRFPAEPEAGLLLYALAMAALDRGDLDQADGWAKRLVREQPRSPYVGDALLRLAERAGRDRPALAREAYRELLAAFKDPEGQAGARFGLAVTALAVGDYAEAQQALEAYLQAAPAGDARVPQAMASLVRALEAQGQAERAVTVAGTFLERFPRDGLAPVVRLARGHLLLGLRRPAEAQEALEAARDQGDPTTAAAAHVWLGELHRARDDHEAAISAYLGATYVYPDLAPWAARGLQGAAESYLGRRMPREAAILLKKLLARPDVEPALAQWARQALTQLGPLTGDDPGRLLRPGGGRP